MAATIPGSVGICRRVQIDQHFYVRGRPGQPEGTVITIEGAFLPGQALVGQDVYVGPASQSAPWIERDNALREAADWKARALDVEGRLAQISEALKGKV